MKRWKRTSGPVILAGLTSVALYGRGSQNAPLPPSESQYEMVLVNMPSTFAVGSQKLPAGDYQIRIEASEEHPQLRFVHDINAQAVTPATRAATHDAKPAEKTAVEVEQIRSVPYVTHVWIRGRRLGYEIDLPENEKTTAPESDHVIEAVLYPPLGSAAADIERSAETGETPDARQ